MKEYRGLYGKVISLEDDKVIATIEFTGETSRFKTTEAMRKLKGKKVKMIVDFLLPVEL